jgi:hypothetical protein
VIPPRTTGQRIGSLHPTKGELQKKGPAGRVTEWSIAERAERAERGCQCSERHEADLHSQRRPGDPGNGQCRHLRRSSGLEIPRAHYPHMIAWPRHPAHMPRRPMCQGRECSGPAQRSAADHCSAGSPRGSISGARLATPGRQSCTAGTRPVDVLSPRRRAANDDNGAVYDRLPNGRPLPYHPASALARNCILQKGRNRRIDPRTPRPSTGRQVLPCLDFQAFRKIV